MPADEGKASTVVRACRGFSFLMMLARAGASIMIGCALAVILPNRFSEEIGAQKIAKLAAPFQGYKYGLMEKEKITVLLIDEKSLEQNSQSWPASYQYYASLLRKLREYRPAAVFIDVVFAHSEKPADLAVFKSEVIQLNGGSDVNPKVFLAARRTDDNRLTISKELDSFESVKEVAIEFSPNEVDRIAWSYQLYFDERESSSDTAIAGVMEDAASHEFASTEAANTTLRSAALSIYEDIYKHPSPAEASESGSMVLTWGLDTAAFGVLWNEEKDEESMARRHFLPRLLRVDQDKFEDAPEHHGKRMYCTSSDSDDTLLWRSLARSVIRSLSRPLCVYHRTIHASQLDELTPGELQEAFHDRTVLIGTSLRNSNDIVTSPLHDRIPGVYLHAMALDNLLNNHYQADWEPPATPFEPHGGRFALLALMCLVPIVAVRFVKDFGKAWFRCRLRANGATLERCCSGSWWLRKSKEAAFNTLVLILSFSFLVVCSIWLLVIGQDLMHVPFLAVSHLIACAVAAEVFELGSKFVDWLTDHEENDDAEKYS